MRGGMIAAQQKVNKCDVHVASAALAEMDMFTRDTMVYFGSKPVATW